MIWRIIKYLFAAIVVIFILLWLVDGGVGKVRAQINRFSFSSPWPWVVSTASDLNNFVTGHGTITLPSVQGVGTTTTPAAQTNQPTPTTETEQERLDQLQAQYENLRAQAQSQGAIH